QYQWMLDPVVTTADIDIPAIEALSFLLIGSNSLGCSDSLQINLTVNPKPEIELIVDTDLKLIRVEPNEFQQYDFMSGNEILQSGSSNQLIYDGLTLVNDSILVRATTGENCISQAQAYIEPMNEYNAFSPNGDGINDIFRKGDFIRVFSRWGVEIFNGDQGWDGRYNGTMVAPGTYYYLHEIRNSAGDLLRTEKGAVTLVKE
ncbi:MAG: gliding motility-associated C-terminal domain-containing protein, partial [Bacteroidales bacterium]|nr:gliding motility-associated C-terminal domain-containing protein [Bacteroidales bacterium]